MGARNFGRLALIVSLSLLNSFCSRPASSQSELADAASSGQCPAKPESLPAKKKFVAYNNGNSLERGEVLAADESGMKVCIKTKSHPKGFEVSSASIEYETQSALFGELPLRPGDTLVYWSWYWKTYSVTHTYRSQVEDGGIFELDSGAIVEDLDDKYFAPISSTRALGGDKVVSIGSRIDFHGPVNQWIVSDIYYSPRSTLVKIDKDGSSSSQWVTLDQIIKRADVN